MILAGLLLLPIAAAADPPRTGLVAPQAGIRTFVEACWRGVRDPTQFDAVIDTLAAARQEQRLDGEYRRVRAGDFEFDYRAGAGCELRFQVGTESEAMQVADQLAEQLGLRSVARYWAADASPSLALWQFRHVPVDKSYYALWVRARAPRQSTADGPYGVEISVSYGTAR